MISPTTSNQRAAKGRNGLRSKRKAGASKVILTSVIAIVIIGVVAASAFLIFSAGRSPSTGADITCSSVKPGNAGVAISIYSGASNSANAPGYTPDKIVVVIGTNNTVTWTNDDSAHHTVTTSSAPSGASFNSGDMGQGATYTCTFTQPGTYQYYCKYHSWMVGTIVVEASK